MEYKYDVFISYSSNDQKIAEGVCGYLERNGYRCFVAYRDIPRGVVWAAAITDAIDESAMMIVVFSQSFNNSPQTDREIGLASENRIPILTYRIADDKMTGAKKYYLKNLNWIDAFPNPENYFGRLLDSVEKLIGEKQNVSETTRKEQTPPRQEPKTSQRLASSEKPTNSFGGHDYVDLGLPSGTLWATCNVGADTPEGYGNYYAWGETNTKINYNWGTYKYANGAYDKLTKYCNKSDYGVNGFTDNLTALQTGDDPAASNWGSGWRTPTKAQWDELLANTTNQWTTQNGVKGRKFTSKKNGQTLFLPAAGGRWGSELYNTGSDGDYWSRSLDTDYPSYAWYLGFDSDNCGMYSSNRSYGFSVRPVRQN